MARAGVQGRTQLRRDLLGFTKGVVATKKKDVVEVALTAAVIGKNVGQNTIATTPSSLSHAPKDNRIWTGRMYDHYDADVKQTGRQIRVRYGWLTDKAKYFLTQEHGGKAFGKDVTPMHALTNSTVAVKDYLKSKGIQA